MALIRLNSFRGLVAAMAMVAGCASIVSEQSRTEELLQVPIERFPTDQGQAGFDEVTWNGPYPVIDITQVQFSGTELRFWFESTRSVYAKAASGQEFEAYCGYIDSVSGAIGDQLERTTTRVIRQPYGSHHGATYYPESIFIGSRQDGLLSPVLTFPDIGTHTTSPHALAIDDQGLCHLVVADVNLHQNNQFNLYWLVGDLQTGDWIKAWLIEETGYTSWAHPRFLVWDESIHLLWNWFSNDDDESWARSGIFYLEWTPQGFKKKVRLATGMVDAWDTSVDPETGVILVAFALKRDVLGMVRSIDGKWSRSFLIHHGSIGALSVDARPGVFVVRTGLKTNRQFEVRVP